MRIDEKWIRERLPLSIRYLPFTCFQNYYLKDLIVMCEGERGGPDQIVYEAKDEEDLKYWQLEQVCYSAGNCGPSRRWRWYRHHAENGQWYYIEHRHYDYNAIEDTRLYSFERFLKNLKYGFPEERWVKKVQEYVSLMNNWYVIPHWDYDREKLRFIEVSDSREHDDHSDIVEEPRPGSIIRTVD